MCLGKMTTATVQHPGLQRADVGPQNNMEANTREREKKKKKKCIGVEILEKS